MIGRTTAIQGTMQRSDESALIRKNEENRPLVDQSNAQKLNEKEVQEKYENVVKRIMQTIIMKNMMQKKRERENIFF